MFGNFNTFNQQIRFYTVCLKAQKPHRIRFYFSCLFYLLSLVYLNMISAVPTCGTYNSLEPTKNDIRNVKIIVKIPSQTNRFSSVWRYI